MLLAISNVFVRMTASVPSFTVAVARPHGTVEPHSERRSFRFRRQTGRRWRQVVTGESDPKRSSGVANNARYIGSLVGILPAVVAANEYCDCDGGHLAAGDQTNTAVGHRGAGYRCAVAERPDHLAGSAFCVLARLWEDHCCLG